MLSDEYHSRYAYNNSNSLEDKVSDDKYNQPHQGQHHTNNGGNADCQLEAWR